MTAEQQDLHVDQCSFFQKKTMTINIYRQPVCHVELNVTFEKGLI